MISNQPIQDDRHFTFLNTYPIAPLVHMKEEEKIQSFVQMESETQCKLVYIVQPHIFKVLLSFQWIFYSHLIFLDETLNSLEGLASVNFNCLS